jgi:hypothetical protein
MDGNFQIDFSSHCHSPRMGWLAKERKEMKLKPLSAEIDELRKIIISSNLTSCYIMLEELLASKGERLFFDKFRARWIDIFKNVYDHVDRMKPRKDQRD